MPGEAMASSANPAAASRRFRSASCATSPHRKDRRGRIKFQGKDMGELSDEELRAIRATRSP